VSHVIGRMGAQHSLAVSGSRLSPAQVSCLVWQCARAALLPLSSMGELIIRRGRWDLRMPCPPSANEKC
jgi:hypothetical protein